MVCLAANSHDYTSAASPLSAFHCKAFDSFVYHMTYIDALDVDVEQLECLASVAPCLAEAFAVECIPVQADSMLVVLSRN